MKKNFFALFFILSYLFFSSQCFSAENNFSTVFDGSAKWDECLYDSSIDTETIPGSVTILKSQLITDDTGNITDATKEQITSFIRAKKEFIIDYPSAEKAVLLLYTNSVPGGSFIIEVNGNVNTITFDKDRMLTGGWSRADINPKQLKKGLNTFVIYPTQANELSLYIDNSIFPNRSAKSSDIGKTWDYDHLGEQGFCNGEYLIRLRLSNYPSSAEILSDYINIGDVITKNPVKPIFSVKDIKLTVDSVIPKDTEIQIFMRGGSTPSYEPSTWDAWRPAKIALSETDQPWLFFQWKAVLKSKTGINTPVLKKINASIIADVPFETNNKITADVSNNRNIIRGYYNFAYQPYNDGRLKKLREYFRLDEVVGCCSTEFEKFETMATWVRSRWRDGWGSDRSNTLKTPWDAWVSLNLNDDFKSSGMCTIYANTFVQCCLAVGLQARGNILDHHFVSEIWSNEYEKWILFDIGFNNQSLRTVHMELDSTPLSSVEILKNVNADKKAQLDLVTPKLWNKKWKGDQSQEAKLLDPVCWKYRVGIPVRNNFLQSWLPGELQHGFNQYTYDGYLWWKKTNIPEYEEYSIQTSHYRDMYWTLNQVEAFLYKTKNDDEIRVILDTITPNLDKLMVRYDNGEWKETAPEFTWKLNLGKNKIEMKSVNKWGLDGIISEITIDKK